MTPDPSLSPPTVRVDGRSLGAALAPSVLRALSPADLARWLVSRRWFGAKGRVPVDARVAEVIQLPWDDVHAAVSRVVVADAAGTVQSYQLPLVARAADLPAATPAVLAHIETEAGRGIVLDALEDERFRARLGAAFADGVVFSGDGAQWIIEPVGDGERELDAVESEVGRAEQSNTNVRYGARAMLKLFRRLEYGENPDVEIGVFLTTHTQFRNTPTLHGIIRYRDPAGADYVAGMLSRLVVGAHDGWALALDAARAAVAAPPPGTLPNVFASEAARIGQVTRALHAALASAPDTPGFRCEPVTARDIEQWTNATRTTIDTALALVTDRVLSLPARDQGNARAIAGRHRALRDQLDAIADRARAALAAAEPQSLPVKTRHHGDYHLGQLLRDASGAWFIVDFEGEPSRPLAQRRALSSPLRDVAGMLRSFAYAAATATSEAGGLGTNPRTEIHAAHWERDVRAAFRHGYGAAGDDPLIALFEMEKLFYELGYELNNRPDWVWIPLRGIARLF